MRWLFSAPARAIALVLLAAAAIGWLGWGATRGPVLSFLPERPGLGEWIVYPAPPSLTMRPSAKMPVEFSRTFECATDLTRVPLRVMAFRDVDVYVNGRKIALPAQPSWKKVRQGTVGKAIRAGTNTIVVKVRNPLGRPAVALALDLPGGALRTDASWTASWGGAEPVPAQLASAPPPPRRLEPGGPPTPPEALAQRLPLLLALFAVALLAAWGLDRLLARGLPGRLAGREWDLALGAIAVLWLALIAHNSPLLHPTYGYDADGHLAYVERIRTTWALPLANEGWQMYHPPLYYAVVAALLAPGGWPADSPMGILVLRLFQALLAIANAWLVLELLRALFPGRTRLHAAGLLFAAFLPIPLYLFHYPTNETLSSTLALAVLVLAARLLTSAAPRPRDFALLGLALGAALLTRITTLIVVPPALAALAWAAWQDRTREGRRARGLGLATVLAVAGVVCGWQYLRVLARFGRPVVGNWDKASGFATWWQDPGFRSAGDFASFGRALVEPALAAVGGVWDGLYATLWGDALLGSVSDVAVRPPWSDFGLAAGMLLALLPTVAILVGAAIGLARIVRAPRPIDLLIGGTAAAGLFALVLFSLKVPAYAQVKAFYALPAAGALVVALALGVERLAGRAPGWRGRIVFALLAVFAANAYATYWIDGRSARAWARPLELARLAEPTQRDERELRAALALDPRDRASWVALERLLAAAPAGQPVDPLRGPGAAALPAPALVGLARLQQLEGRPERAQQLLSAAIARDPLAAEPWFLRAAWRAEGDSDAAIADLRSALRADPHHQRAHAELARLLEARGDTEEAKRQATFADRLKDPGKR
jgi:tetratricopeptide (TPR) repeat protein